MTSGSSVKSEEHKKNISIALRKRYANGGKHPWTGRKHTTEWKENMTGSNNHKWKGDKVSYQALHNWVARHRGRPSKCDYCGLEDTNRKRYFNWANKSKKYLRDLDDWIRLCVPCHRVYDKKEV